MITYNLLSLHMLINSAKDELQNTRVAFLGKMELQVIKTAYFLCFYNICILNCIHMHVYNDDITKIKTNVNLI